MLYRKAIAALVLNLGTLFFLHLVQERVSLCIVGLAQAAVVSLAPEGFQSDGLTGIAIGTAADGTTYVLEGKTSGVPFTRKLVVLAPANSH